MSIVLGPLQHVYSIPSSFSLALSIAESRYTYRYVYLQGSASQWYARFDIACAACNIEGSDSLECRSTSLYWASPRWRSRSEHQSEVTMPLYSGPCGYRLTPIVCLDPNRSLLTSEYCCTCTMLCSAPCTVYSVFMSRSHVVARFSTGSR